MRLEFFVQMIILHLRYFVIATADTPDVHFSRTESNSGLIMWRKLFFFMLTMILSRKNTYDMRHIVVHMIKPVKLSNWISQF